MSDLFDKLVPASPFGLKVRLDRECDRERPCPCGDNVAILRPTSPMHAGELRCAQWGAFRGWAPKTLITFVTETARRFGAPAEPITWRQQQQQKKAMEFDNTNRGAIFRNDDKVEGTSDRDYSGTLNVAGVEHWVSGWVKISKNGKKYLSLSVKPKIEQTTSKRPIAEDLNHEIPL
jgi:hypothetical protein